MKSFRIVAGTHFTHSAPGVTVKQFHLLCCPYNCESACHLEILNGPFSPDVGKPNGLHPYNCESACHLEIPNGPFSPDVYLLPAPVTVDPPHPRTYCPSVEASSPQDLEIGSYFTSTMPSRPFIND